MTAIVTTLGWGKRARNGFANMAGLCDILHFKLFLLKTFYTSLPFHIVLPITFLCLSSYSKSTVLLPDYLTDYHSKTTTTTTTTTTMNNDNDSDSESVGSGEEELDYDEAGIGEPEEEEERMEEEEEARPSDGSPAVDAAGSPGRSGGATGAPSGPAGPAGASASGAPLGRSIDSGLDVVSVTARKRRWAGEEGVYSLSVRLPPRPRL